MEWLLTWLWQGSAVVLLVACLLRATPFTSPSTRFLVWWAALLAVLALPWANRLWTVTVTFPSDAAASLEASSPALLPVTLPAVPSSLVLASLLA